MGQAGYISVEGTKITVKYNFHPFAKWVNLYMYHNRGIIEMKVVTQKEQMIGKVVYFKM